MNFGTAQQEDETGIELTPLIDVVFLLLIFFMISTTFTKETSLRINLPEASGDDAANQPLMVEVHVGAGAVYAIASNRDAVAKTLVNSNRDTLLRALSKFSPSSATSGERSGEILLVIRADKKATHEAVIKVLDVAQQLGLSNITFATKRGSE